MTPQEYAQFWGEPNTSDYSNNKASAYDTFKQVFGRAPTRDEANQILPAFGNDPHIPNSQAGNAYISQLHQATENTPDKIYAKQQAEYQKNAPQHYDSINKLFQGSLGRAASQEELDHFGSMLASGTTDSYQLQQFLQQQPEYTQKQDQGFRDQLSGQLAGYDKEYFDKSILPSIQEAYAKQGRSFDSSAFQGAATNSAQQQNTQRQQYIAGLSASQYGGRQDRAYQDYANMLQQQQGLTNAGVNAAYTGIQNAQNRSNDLADMNTQQQMYNQYLARYGRRNNGFGGAIGTALGAGLGGYFGGIEGAKAGGTLGGSFGTGIQNSGGSY